MPGGDALPESESEVHGAGHEGLHPDHRHWRRAAALAQVVVECPPAGAGHRKRANDLEAAENSHQTEGGTAEHDGASPLAPARARYWSFSNQAIRAESTEPEAARHLLRASAALATC